MPPPRSRHAKASRRKAKAKPKAKKRDPIFIDGERPRPMYVDYKDLDLLGKFVNRQAVTRAVKRARFMALLPYVTE